MNFLKVRSFGGSLRAMARYGFHVMMACATLGFGVVVCDNLRMGPFDVKILSVASCNEPISGGYSFQSKIRKYNRTMVVVSGSGNITQDFDDSLDLTVDLAVHTGNGWKENYLRQTLKKACSVAMSYAGNLFSALLKKAGVKVACPVPKGYYTAEDLPLAVDVKGIPAFVYGKYRWKLYGSSGKAHRNIFCLEALLDVIPKSKH